MPVKNVRNGKRNDRAERTCASRGHEKDARRKAWRENRGKQHKQSQRHSALPDPDRKSPSNHLSNESYPLPFPGTEHRSFAMRFNKTQKN